MADQPLSAETREHHQEAIRALEIMDALNRLALRYPVLEVLDTAKKWVAFIDGQAKKYADEEGLPWPGHCQSCKAPLDPPDRKDCPTCLAID